MKIKLFNGKPLTLSLRLLSGGYDSDSGKMVLIVAGEEGAAGSISIDITESREVVALLSAAPNVERVEIAKGDTDGKK